MKAVAQMPCGGAHVAVGFGMQMKVTNDLYRWWYVTFVAGRHLTEWTKCAPQAKNH